MTEEQMDRMIEIRNAYKAGDITEQEHLEMIDVEVFGNSPVTKIKNVDEAGEGGFVVTMEQFMGEDFQDSVQAAIEEGMKTYVEPDREYREDLQTTVPNKYGHPTLTPEIMDNWMMEFGEDFMVDGPLSFYDADFNLIENTFDEDFIAKVKLDKKLYETIMEETGFDPDEMEDPANIDEIMTYLEDEELNTRMYQIYCDIINEIDIDTTDAWELHP